MVGAIEEEACVAFRQPQISRVASSGTAMLSAQFAK
jgi:hypothetical protein